MASQVATTLQSCSGQARGGLVVARWQPNGGSKPRGVKRAGRFQPGSGLPRGSQEVARQAVARHQAGLWLPPGHLFSTNLLATARPPGCLLCGRLLPPGHNLFTSWLPPGCQPGGGQPKGSKQEAAKQWPRQPGQPGSQATTRWQQGNCQPRGGQAAAKIRPAIYCLAA